MGNNNNLFGISAGLGETITEIDLDDLVMYKDQPFKLYAEDQLEALKHDMAERGLDNPIIVRPYNGEYQILAGHNRYQAAKLLNWETIPAVIKQLNDEEAILQLVQSNLMQREKIFPSEKVKAYTLRSKALKQQEKHSESERKYKRVEELGLDISERTLSRYIACSKLIDEWLEWLDQSKISLSIGESLSILTKKEQRWLIDFLINHDLGMKAEEAHEIHDLKKVGMDMDDTTLESIFFKQQGEEHEKVPQKKKSKTTVKEDMVQLSRLRLEELLTQVFFDSLNASESNKESIVQKYLQKILGGK